MRRFSLYLLWTAENLKHSSHRRIEMDNLLQRMQVDMDLRNLSEKTKQVYSALKLLYETTLDAGWDLNEIPHAKQRKKLPVGLSQQQVCAVLEAAPNPERGSRRWSVRWISGRLLPWRLPRRWTDEDISQSG